MTDLDTVLQKALRQAEANPESGDIPDFDSVWAAAGDRVASQRTRRRVFAGSVVAAAVAAVALGLLMPRGADTQFVDREELLGTTSWFAPSDSLLPERQLDIYQDIPVLIESTDSYGGALL
ncbi:MAG: hypothetical protein KJO95_05400 [Gammaproteobacteria bacterium]|nr:hypothetical protein [Gammaproteobacteria bacterium]MBU2676845.1 hypothetical protein [Gammaproteobacteria bacterium]NNC58247.1 hypothetical protein [Woeseiaceae bacterium]NNL50579.1 hypothetical protein [Woeseiaceae bacterium]